MMDRDNRFERVKLAYDMLVEGIADKYDYIQEILPKHILQEVFERPIDVAVLCMGNDNLAYAVSVLNAFRDANIASVAYLEAEKKFKNQIEYADKINAKFSAIIGEDEVKNHVVALKNMQTGMQETLSVKDAIKIVTGV